MYQVLARKWRPKGFDELVGQDHVARTLRNSIDANRLAHAYIFAGLRGTGKTTVARILAKCLNCVSGPTARPCGECVPCREISDGRAMDVLEMDAASRTGIDDVRELQEIVQYAAVRDRYKVLIIDEAHMLSRSAANGLLKTLEEPPPRVVFVLATTEVQKLLPTILSRCQVYEFRRVSPRDVAAHLRRVCDAESIQVSDAVLERIARAGEGSVRDALSLLERVVAFAGPQVSEDDALLVLGAVRADRIEALVAALGRRDAAAMIGVLDALAAEGHDLLHVWSELIAALRDLLLIRAAPDAGPRLSRSPEEATALVDAAAGLSREDLTRAFQIVADLEFGLKASALPQFLFEAALVRLADLGAVRPIEDVLRSLGPAAPPPRPGRLAPAAVVPPAEKKSPAAAEPAAAGDPTAVFRARLRDARPMIAALLDKAGSLEWAEDGALRIVVAHASEAVGRQIASPDTVRLLEGAAAEAVGRPVRVRVEIEAAATRAATEPGGAAAAHRRSPERQAPRTAALDAARAEPGVSNLLREFGADVVDFRALDPIADAGGDPSEDGG